MEPLPGEVGAPVSGGEEVDGSGLGSEQQLPLGGGGRRARSEFEEMG